VTGIRAWLVHAAVDGGTARLEAHATSRAMPLALAAELRAGSGEEPTTLLLSLAQRPHRFDGRGPERGREHRGGG
jgi:hypothetical protein